MLDMGFEEDLNYVLDALPLSNLKPEEEENEVGGLSAEMPDAMVHGKKYRQTVMFSATMPPAVERLAKKYLRRPAVVTIGTAGQAVDRIEQRVELINDDNKKKHRLFSLLGGEFRPPIIVFVNQRRSCDILSKALEDEGVWLQFKYYPRTNDIISSKRLHFMVVNLKISVRRH
jgi:ATP-dependent RNA helicase DDX23/PRP28